MLASQTKRSRHDERRHNQHKRTYAHGHPERPNFARLLDPVFRLRERRGIDIHFVVTASTPGVVGMVSARMVFTSRARSDSSNSTRTISIPARNDCSSSQ